MSKQQLERDICIQFITPALQQAVWELYRQIREEFTLTNGQIIVRGKLHICVKNKRADDVLFYKPNLLLAALEAKDNNSLEMGYENT